MAKWKNVIKRYLPTQRRLIQLYTALLYNAHIKGFITGNIYTGTGKVLCVQGLNFYSCPGAIGACPLGALQNAIASSGSRTPAYIIGILMLCGLILGRTICGYLCPTGLVQELLHKIPTPKLKKSAFTRVLSYLKYVLLAVFVLLIPMWYGMQSLPVPAFCKYICPTGTLEGAVGLLANPVNADKYSMLGVLFVRKFLILGLIVVVCVFVHRAFCRFLCPLGAIYGLFSKVAIIGVKVEATKCIDCGRCVSHCPMDIRHVSDHECVHCGRCIPVCPTGAIRFQAGKYTVESKSSSCEGDTSKRRSIAWSIAIVFLVAVLFFVNVGEGTNMTQSPAEKVSVGKDVGMLAPDFSVPVYGSNLPFVLSEHRGKKVVINFWATWCTPCCQELPYFDAAYREYQDRAIVIAVHSDLVTDDVEAYLTQYDYALPFALDEKGDVIRMFGGSTMLPMTVIIDENGVIIYNAVGSMTLEQLKAFLD